MNKDMSDPVVQAEYDIQIYDGARDIAVTYKRDVQGMQHHLRTIGVTNQTLLDAVAHAQSHSAYEEINYRGAMVDEGVIEALKDCLRPLHGFA